MVEGDRRGFSPAGIEMDNVRPAIRAALLESAPQLVEAALDYERIEDALVLGAMGATEMQLGAMQERGFNPTGFEVVLRFALPSDATALLQISGREPCKVRCVDVRDRAVEISAGWGADGERTQRDDEDMVDAHALATAAAVDASAIGMPESRVPVEALQGVAWPCAIKDLPSAFVEAVAPSSLEGRNLAAECEAVSALTRYTEVESLETAGQLVAGLKALLIESLSWQEDAIGWTTGQLLQTWRSLFDAPPPDAVLEERAGRDAWEVMFLQPLMAVTPEQSGDGTYTVDGIDGWTGHYLAAAASVAGFAANPQIPWPPEWPARRVAYEHALGFLPPQLPSFDVSWAAAGG